MINPELIAGMLFLPSMSDNEAIETVGAERFSNYSGYASTFRYAGNHVDVREIDSFGRRKTIIVAIDALRNPGLRQYRVDSLLREVNKAFCGFLDQPNYQQYQMLLQYCDSCVVRGGNDPMDADVSDIQATLVEDSGMSPDNNEAKTTQNVTSQMQVHHSDVGIATGNWGCGAFGGDPELKSVIQWLAASQVTLTSISVLNMDSRRGISELLLCPVLPNRRCSLQSFRLPFIYYTGLMILALRPYILHYTFGIEELRNLDQVCKWIMSHNWTVGDLWNMLVDYSSKRAKGETKLGFFSWLLPC
ncbi:hypothetical protein BVRB_3g059390 isoform D [Beta vulgaris subsp. vulgaris]|nr:hypothetical protein BVRB_3g059390 isoform D [Beta vulgaris subsp. vulgaris]